MKRAAGEDGAPTISASMFREWSPYRDRAMAAGKDFTTKHRATGALEKPIIASFAAIEPEHISVLDVTKDGKPTNVIYVVAERGPDDSGTQVVTRYIVLPSALAIVAKTNPRVDKFIRQASELEPSGTEAKSRPAKAVERAEKSVDDEEAKVAAAVAQPLRKLNQVDPDRIERIEVTNQASSDLSDHYSEARDPTAIQTDAQHVFDVLRSRCMAQRTKDRDSDVFIDPMAKPEGKSSDKSKAQHKKSGK
jgi:hypothetical protein